MTTPDTSTPITTVPAHGCRCMACNRWIDSDVHAEKDSIEHCPRCGANNREWSRLTAEDHFKRFSMWAWGLVLVLLVVGNSIALTMGASWKPEPALRPLPVRLMSLLVLAIAVLVYRARHHIRSYELFRRTMPRRHRPSLAMVSVLCILFAVLLAVIVALIQWWATAETPKLIYLHSLLYLPWLLYLFLAPAAAMAIMLLATRRYVNKLDEDFDRPIYCNHDRLFEVIWNSLKKTCLLLNSETDESSADNAEASAKAKIPMSPECVSSSRNRGGGLDLTIRRTWTTKTRDPESHEYITSLEEKTYLVNADKWGEIVSFMEQAKTPTATSAAG